MGEGGKENVCKCARDSQTGGVKACMSHLSAPNATQAAISVVCWILPEGLEGLEAPGACANTASRSLHRFQQQLQRRRGRRRRP